MLGVDQKGSVSKACLKVESKYFTRFFSWFTFLINPRLRFLLFALCSSPRLCYWRLQFYWSGVHSYHSYHSYHSHVLLPFASMNLCTITVKTRGPSMDQSAAPCDRDLCAGGSSVSWHCCGAFAGNPSPREDFEQRGAQWRLAGPDSTKLPKTVTPSPLLRNAENSLWVAILRSPATVKSPEITVRSHKMPWNPMKSPWNPHEN